ncbi:FAD-binding oxidoreductase [Aliikangiella marina]|uniref:FAD-binding oxidoreductase n=1 Tax=Aliikangiella marina TaxID=1712262 RepID=A0A545TJV6_9GAMM|nr:FAD-binding oxidoreductase [Aliikangiella marina]TQV77466.1 FAD-binding oxidoreductase [Aliikangiella marina]
MSDLIRQLKDIIGDNYVLTDKSDLDNYGQDWSRLYQPDPIVAVRPGSNQEVAEIVKLCQANKVSIVPSGGRTGLSGGAVATNQELVLSLDRLNQIANFNPVDRTVECGAGVITQQLQDFASENGLFYPVDFASAGSSQIGGNIATNAGGIKVLKYGLTRDWVAGLTVVTSEGEILELNHALVKNATGYDLRHLMIGSEGTLGIITQATMRLANPPQEPTVMLLAVSDLPSVSHLLEHFQSNIDLMAFEFFSQQALEKVMAHRELKTPFADSAEFYVLVEFECPGEAEMEKAFAAFESAAENGWLVDGIISQSNQQAEELWQYREGISESIAHYPPYKNDIAVKPSLVGEFLQQVDSFVTTNYPAFENIWFGHIGDGNLHLNILKPENMDVETFKETCAKANPEIFSILKGFNGSISAEHGVGLLKKDYLNYSRSDTEIALMKAVKKVFDPNNILNPGKLL